MGFKLRKVNKQDKSAPGGLEQEHEASPEIIKSMESCLTKRHTNIVSMISDGIRADPETAYKRKGWYARRAIPYYKFNFGLSRGIRNVSSDRGCRRPKA